MSILYVGVDLAKVSRGKLPALITSHSGRLARAKMMR
jgi:hypothetical protein